MVKKNQSFPADVVLLNSSHASGIAYVSTANLDGESGIKARTTFDADGVLLNRNNVNKMTHQKHKSTDFRQHTFNHLMNLPIERTEPQPGVSGIRVKIDGREVDKNSFMFRGCFLKHTRSVIALVTFTGPDTIIMLNTKQTPNKRSDIDDKTDRILYVLVFITHLFTLIVSILAEFRVSLTVNESIGENNFVIKYLLNLLVFSFLTPLALYSAKIVIQGLQVIQIEHDKKMDKKCKVNNFQVIPALGHVNIVLTDKTGTLTRNEMALKSLLFKNSQSMTEKLEIDSSLENAEDQIEFNKMLRKEENLKRLFQCILICHSSYISAEEVEGSPQEISKEYLCTNQDDEALLLGLKKVGATMDDKGTKHIRISYGGEFYEFELTDLGIEFTSKHKFMTVVVKSVNKYYAFTKGAFENLLPMMRKETLILNHDESLMQYYTECLRVLCMCMQEYDHAPTQKELWSETQYEFLGFSATEDRLAPKVPQTIKLLNKAGIAVHILTGDNPFTAENISMKCGHVIQYIDTCVLRPEHYVQGQLKLEERPPLCPNDYAIFNHKMIIEALQDPLSFVTYIKNGKCIFSRADPSQKAEITRAITQNSNLTVLTVGDGANDVAMIQKGSVGIGIAGKEGKMAANSGDFSIHTFKHLVQLILVYGAWNYDRVTKCILFFIYKNIVFVVPVICYLFLIDFMPVFLYEPVAAMLFNVLFSSFLILPMSAFDHRISSDFRIKYPVLYKATLKRNKLKMNKVISWLVNGTFHGLLIYWTIYIVLTQYPLIDTLGGIANLGYLSFLTLTCVLCVITLKAFTEGFQVSCFMAIFSLSSLIFYFCYLTLYIVIFPHFEVTRNAFEVQHNIGVFSELFMTPQTYFIIIIILVICILRDIAWKFIKRTYFWRIEDLTLNYERGLHSTYEKYLFMHLKQITRSAALKTGIKRTDRSGSNVDEVLFVS